MLGIFGRSEEILQSSSHFVRKVLKLRIILSINFKHMYLTPSEAYQAAYHRNLRKGMSQSEPVECSSSDDDTVPKVKLSPEEAPVDASSIKNEFDHPLPPCAFCQDRGTPHIPKTSCWAICNACWRRHEYGQCKMQDPAETLPKRLPTTVTEPRFVIDPLH